VASQDVFHYDYLSLSNKSLMLDMDNMRRLRVTHRAELCTVIGLICLSALSSAQSPVESPTVSPVASDERAHSRYVVAKDDLLTVDVVGSPELSREFRVDGDGMITLPMLPRPVMASGLTLDQLSQAIRRNLIDSGLLTDPQVTVSVKSSSWNTVVLSGAAKKPGVYPVYGHTTLLELLTEAEGLSDDAGSSAIITRADQSSPGPTSAQPVPGANAETMRTVKVDVWRLWQNGDASLDVALRPGDRVTIQRAGIVYVLGGVTRAGGFPLSNDEEKMTLLKAIALAGAFVPDAKPTKAVILRKDPSAPGGRQEIQVNLKKVLSNRAPDEQLVASDILFVPESGAKRALGTVMNTALGAAIWRVPY